MSKLAGPEEQRSTDEVSAYAEFGAWATTCLALGYGAMLFVAESAGGWLGELLTNVRLYQPQKPGDDALVIAYLAEVALAGSLALCAGVALSAHLGIANPHGKWRPIFAAAVPPAILSFLSLAVLGWVGNDSLTGKVLLLAFILLGTLTGMLTSGALADAAARDAKAEMEAREPLARIRAR